MRILHLTDLHFHKPWFSWAAKAAGDFDLVAISGDLLDCDGRIAIEPQVTWVRAWVGSFPGPLAICSGNHDLPTAWLRELAGPKVVVDGGTLELGGWAFESVGWGDLPTMGGTRQVALVHCPPEMCDTSTSQADGTDWGDFELSELLRRGPAHNRPCLVLSGHVHKPRSWAQRVNGSWSFNPGAAVGGNEPRRIIMDLERGIAERQGPDVATERIRWQNPRGRTAA